jgi:aminopeptidase N
MTLQALRRKIGDRAFFDLLRTWYRDHRGGNVTTAEPGGQAAELVRR